MLGFSSKLQKWQDAGLITADQSQQIAVFEKSSKSGRLSRGLIGVAIFSIIIGILSMIAANWHDISGTLKISVHVILNMVLAIVILTRQGIVREGAIFLLYGLTLTLIVLIGQVYQLDGNLSSALAIWMFATTPMVFAYGQRGITAWPWVLGFVVSAVIIFGELSSHHNYEIREFSFALYLMGLALGLVLVGRHLEIVKTVFAEVMMRVGIICMTLLAMIGTLKWWWHNSYNEQQYIWIIFAFLIVVGGHIAYMRFVNFHTNSRSNTKEQKLLTLYLLGCSISLLLPYLFSSLIDRSSSDGDSIISALHFMVFWGFSGVIGQALGWQRLVTFSIMMLTLRIFVVYIELFGDLFSTGVSLILGGIVMLSLLWGANKTNKYLKKAGQNV